MDSEDHGEAGVNGSFSHDLDIDTVLIAGGGPVGLLLSVVLASHGIKSILLERNVTTTKWPKMDLTNTRSMEMFRRLGLAQGLRERGVPSHIPSTVLISGGLGKKEAITKWLHPSVNEYRTRIAQRNDGTQPLEPYQRVSQAIFEAWLKDSGDSSPFIDVRFGWNVEFVEELENGTRLLATEVSSGAKHILNARFLVGCDGASSQVRRSLKITLDGGPVPGYVLLVHFKSKDLTRLQNQGQFWHIFFLGKEGFVGAIIAQDEVDTWTTHLQLRLDSDPSQIDSHEAIYRVLGGLDERYEINVDEILVRSTYRPSIAVANSYGGPRGGIFLGGDAAHQNIPTWGYGMNMGLGDAFDLGWKLATFINGNGGDRLLDSYEADRRPVALMNIERSGVHMATHMAAADILQPDMAVVDEPTNEGQKMRQKVHEHYQKNDGENTDLGVEMGYRYKSSICIPDEKSVSEPEWVPSRYTPTTWPGGRAPHVFLNDGSAMFDHFGGSYTLIEFRDISDSDQSVDFLIAAARADAVLLKHVPLVGEENAHRLWERRLVIVRPDGHVSWRSNKVTDLQSASNIIRVIAGLVELDTIPLQPVGSKTKSKADATFKMIVRETQENEYRLEKMGEFQQ